MDPKFKTKGMKTAKLMVLSVLVLLLRGKYCVKYILVITSIYVADK